MCAVCSAEEQFNRAQVVSYNRNPWLGAVKPHYINPPFLALWSLSSNPIRSITLTFAIVNHSERFNIVKSGSFKQCTLKEKNTFGVMASLFSHTSHTVTKLTVRLACSVGAVVSQ